MAQTISGLFRGAPSSEHARVFMWSVVCKWDAGKRVTPTDLLNILKCTCLAQLIRQPFDVVTPKVSLVGKAVGEYGEKEAVGGRRWNSLGRGLSERHHFGVIFVIATNIRFSVCTQIRRCDQQVAIRIQ